MINSETKVGDEIEYNGEKGTVKAIIGDGRVAEVEIPITSIKTVYVEIPQTPAPPTGDGQ